MGFSKLIKRLLADDKSMVEQFQDTLTKNPFYPFSLGLSSEGRLRVFTFKQAYEEKYWAMTGGGISFILLLILVVLGEASKGVAAYYLIVLLIYCTCAYIQYNDDKVIILDEGSMTYCLTVNKRRIVGNYHNIYIRLVLERSNVLAKKHDHVPAYRLVLSGVKIDPTQLTRKPTDDIKGLRRLGQKLAKNLNINYFDEANVSVNHLVRHLPVDYTT